MTLRLFEEVINDPYYRDQLEKAKEMMQPINIVVVGVGGAGVNMVKRLSTMGIKHVTLIAVNTDIQQLLDLQDFLEKQKKAGNNVTDVIILPIGQKVTEGKGAGGNPRLAAKAAEENKDEIANLLKDADLVFIAAGEGGGTGTGASPVIARIAKEVTRERRGEEKEALVISIVTFPFVHEKRYDKALMGIKALARYSDTVLVIENERLVKVAGKQPVESAFRIFVDELVARTISELAHTINEPSVVNIDFNDVKVVMKSGGIAMIGVGESDSKTNRASEAIRSAIENRFMDVEVKNAKGALVHFTIGDDVTLEEIYNAISELRKYLNNDAELFFGARTDPNLRGIIRAFVIVSGVENKYYDEDDFTLEEIDRIDKYFGLTEEEEQKYNPLAIIPEL